MKEIDLLSAIIEIDDEMIYAAGKKKLKQEEFGEQYSAGKKESIYLYSEGMEPVAQSADGNRRRIVMPALLAMAAVAVLAIVILRLVPSPGDPAGNDSQGENGLYLSDGLLLTAKIPESPEELHVYTLEYYASDEESAVPALMSHKPDHKEERALGPCYIYQDLEYLTLSNQVVMGGLQYVKNIDGLDRDTDYMISGLRDSVTRSIFPNNGNNTMGQKEYLTEFSTDIEIGSVTQEEVQKQLAQLWKQLKFPDLEMYVCYTRDKDALNRNLKEYISYLPTTNSDKRPDYVFTDDDEDYLIYYRQQIDGIPLANQAWWVQVTSEPTQTTFTVHYSPLYGLTYLMVSNLYNVKEKLPEVEIVDPKEAIDKYVQEYDKSIHFEMTEITNIELCYIVVHEKDALIARPAWVLTVLKDSQDPDSDIRVYEIAAIDAENLGILKSVNAGD